jgi:Spy/CpxP family protein refolding chaperone
MIAFLTLFLAVLFIPPVYGQNSYSEFERGLELSNAQRVKIEQMRKRYMVAMRTLQQQSMLKRLELRDMRRNAPQNREGMERLRGEIEDLELEKASLYGQYNAELKQMLTEKQREQYNRFCDTESRRNTNPFRQRGHGP